MVPTRRVIENYKKIVKKFKNTITACSQAKIGWKRQRKRKNKIYHSVSFLLDPKQKNSKKEAKKFKKLKNTITASFQAKIGWKRLRMRENKNYNPVSFLPNT